MPRAGRPFSSVSPERLLRLRLLDRHSVDDGFTLAHVLGRRVVGRGYIHTAFLPFDLFGLAVRVRALDRGIALQYPRDAVAACLHRVDLAGLEHAFRGPHPVVVDQDLLSAY